MAGAVVDRHPCITPKSPYRVLLDKAHRILATILKLG
jgi:hypothetical protein